ncbi:MAG TPA: hypothetical protein VGB94_04875 [Acidobacteriaceae bacterium]
MATSLTGAAVLYSEQQKAEVCRQLDRMLANPHFCHSKRFPSFLRFIVQEALEGRGEQLKERTLGIEVFGRDPGYDTTLDPIVRVTAAEIRKRIAQYYQDTNDPDQLRLSLPAGSYIPQFDWPQADALPISGTNPSNLELVPQESLPPIAALKHAEAHKFSGRLFGVAVLLALLLASGFYWKHPHHSALDRFWAPVLEYTDPVTICFPQSHLPGIILRDAADPTRQHHMDEPMSGVVLDDLQPLVKVSGLLEMRNQRYLLLGADTTTLTDLRQGSAIFLGAFDNAWTLRMTRNLRYRFGNDADMTHFWIEDTQSSTHQTWSIDRNIQEATNNYRDYAIVARFRDATTGKFAIIAAGIARGGTVAAGEFLTQPGNMEAVFARAPHNWSGENLEFVLSTEIIDGRSAAPRIEATYFW